MFSERTKIENSIDFDAFESNLCTEIADNINVGRLRTIAEKLVITDDLDQHPAEMILFTKKENPQFKAIVELILEGCRQGIPEAGRALKMLNNWLGNEEEDNDLMVVLGGRDNITNFKGALERFSLPANIMWEHKGKELNETLKLNEKGKETESSTETDSKSDLLEMPKDLAQKAKTSPEGDIFENMRLMKNGHIEAVEEKYKERVAKMKKTLIGIHSGLPKLLQELDSFAVSPFIERTRGKLVTRFDFVNQDSENKDHYARTEYEKFDEYLRTDFSAEYNEIEKDDNPEGLSEESSFIATRLATKDLDKFYTRELDRLVMTLFTFVWSETKFGKIDKNVYKEYVDIVTRFLKQFDVYIALPKCGDKLDNETLHNLLIEPEVDNSLPSGTIKDIREPGFYQMFEDNRVKIFKKPTVESVK